MTSIEAEHAMRIARPSHPSAFVRTLAVVLPLAVSACATESAETGPPQETGRDLQITPFSGASIQLEYGGVVIHVDPWSRGDYSDADPADLILVTDTPGDHLDPELIAELRKPGAPVVLPSTPEDARDDESRARLLQVEDGIVMSNGDRVTLAGVDVEAVPMYDLIPGDPFHARGEGNGYVLTLGETRVYISGVTECVPEIQTLRDIDIAFVPMNLPHGRMPPAAAADCVKIIRPAVVYPYHYREQPIDEFVAALASEEDIEVRVHDWYP